MIENILYLLDNPVPENQIEELFKDKNYHYIKNILQLRDQYLQIKEIYSNEAKNTTIY